MAGARRSAQGDVCFRRLFCQRLFCFRPRRASPSTLAAVSRLWRGWRRWPWLGYISPVSTLIKWFPDGPGMATGMAIMGFGGGALIGGPLATNLWSYFNLAASCNLGVGSYSRDGVRSIFFDAIGVFTVRVPPEGWKPGGWEPRRVQSFGDNANVDVEGAFGYASILAALGRFCMNVSCGNRNYGTGFAHDPGHFPGKSLARGGRRLRGPCNPLCNSAAVSSGSVDL